MRMRDPLDSTFNFTLCTLSLSIISSSTYTCTHVCLVLKSMFTLVLRYLCLITLVLVSMAAYLWYMTVLAMLLRGGGGA